MPDFDNKLNMNEVLDFEDDALPEDFGDDAFPPPQGKKPWLLVGVGIIAVTLVAVVLMRFMTGGGTPPRPAGSETVEILIDGEKISIETPSDDFVDGANELVKVDGAPVGMPDRVVEARKPIKFDPDKPVVQRPTNRPAPRPAEGSGQARKVQPTAQPARTGTTTGASGGIWMAQVGSYNTRTAAESGQRQLQNRAAFSGRNFVILQAVLPNGNTVHRLRVTGFANAAAAESFCREIRQGGTGCYATK